MAETPGSAAAETRVWVRFVARKRRRSDDPLVTAQNPQPSWTVCATEVGDAAADEVPIGEYALWNPLNLISADSLRVMELETDTPGLTGREHLARAREQVRLCMPAMPDAVFERLSTQQLLWIAKQAWQRPDETASEASAREADALNPPGGERASDSSSRSPLGSLAGAIGS